PISGHSQGNRVAETSFTTGLGRDHEPSCTPVADHVGYRKGERGLARRSNFIRRSRPPPDQASPIVHFRSASISSKSASLTLATSSGSSHMALASRLAMRAGDSPSSSFLFDHS